MSAECYPITILPHVSALYRDYLAMADSAPQCAAASMVRRGAFRSDPGWTVQGSWCGVDFGRSRQQRLSGRIESLVPETAALANIAKLRDGACAVVTGQQVGLLGADLSLRCSRRLQPWRGRARRPRATGVDHVPIFWLATEDHDLAEVDQVSLLTKTAVETLRAGLRTPAAVPVGEVPLGDELESLLDQATELLGWAPICDVLRECYLSREGYRATLGGAFARLMTRIFADQGLIVIDAAGREFHRLGRATLRGAIERADELEQALLRRGEELEGAGYHAQVKVAMDMSLLFLISDAHGGNDRQALRRSADGSWKAGRQTYTTADLLRILDETPERISPNALLRPVFQDTILPTVAYVGGPSEIAYFAQSAVLYESLLGRLTPVLPRWTATLLEPAIATVMDADEVQLPEAMTSPELLGQRLGARSMPIEVKRRLAAVGSAMDAELDGLTEYLSGMDASLGRSAEVSGSKMRYQMNRLRRMAATHELAKDASLRKHASAISLNVFPNGHPQERVVAGVWFLARYEGLISRFVEEAARMCGGHSVVRL